MPVICALVSTKSGEWLLLDEIFLVNIAVVSKPEFSRKVR